MDFEGKNIYLENLNSISSRQIMSRNSMNEDFEEFKGSVPYYTLPDKYSFTIYDKKTQEPVGYVGVYSPDYGYIKSENTYLNEYYIYPEYRGKGYAKEALERVTEAALSGEIKENMCGDPGYRLSNKSVKIDIMYGFVEEENIASQRVQLSCGYKHMGKFYNMKEQRLVRYELYMKTREGLLINIK